MMNKDIWHEAIDIARECYCEEWTVIVFMSERFWAGF